MQHTTLEHEGAWTFGESQRSQWFILKNKEIPGPGTHPDSKNATGTSWTMGKSTRGTSFIPPHSNAAVGTYSPNIDPTRPTPIQISVGNSTRPQLPQSLTKDTNYDPSLNYSRNAAPLYSLGYSQPMDYSTGVPPPGTYENGRPASSISFNRKEIGLTTADRPTPYGEEVRYPGVGKYEVQGGRIDGPKIRFGTGDRPEVDVCPDSPIIFYNSKSQFGKEGKGWSLGEKLPVQPPKDDFPAPNVYYPEQPGKARKGGIFTTTSYRTGFTGLNCSVPAPGTYNISSSLDAKITQELAPGIAFPRSHRSQLTPPDAPPPGTYDIASKLNTTHGKMGWKLQKLVKHVTPSVHDYQPNTCLTERRERESLTFYANRTDFSKSTTRALGPGAYELRGRLGRELGKMGNSARPRIRSQTPGPGQYELPPTLGRIPKYYKNLDRKISEHGHTKWIKYDPKKTREIKLSAPVQQDPKVAQKKAS